MFDSTIDSIKNNSMKLVQWPSGVGHNESSGVGYVK